MKTKWLFILMMVSLNFSSPVFSRELKIATWKIQNLRIHDYAGPNSRDQNDINRLEKYAINLNADIIALQGVQGGKAAQRLFSSNKYHFYFSRMRHSALTGFAVKKEFNVVQNSDLEVSKNSYRHKHSTDISVKIGNTQIRLLSVDLYPGCRNQSIYSEGDNNPCKLLINEFRKLRDWIADRRSEGGPFFILGNFNRYFDKGEDSSWNIINDGETNKSPLIRVTKDKRSNCWQDRSPYWFADHIILDQEAAKLLVPNSFKQTEYQESYELRDRMSYYCPISVILNGQDYNHLKITPGISEHGPPIEPEFPNGENTNNLKDNQIPNNSQGTHEQEPPVPPANLTYEP